MAASKLLPEVEKFLSSAPLKGIVGGKDVAGSAGETMKTIDPGNGKTLAEFCCFSPEDVDRAVGAAAHAFKKSGWATMPANERGALLHRLAGHVPPNHGAGAVRGGLRAQLQPRHGRGL